MVMMLLVSCMIVSDNTSTSIREQELKQITRRATITALTSSNLRELYDVSDEEMQAEFIMDFSESVSSDSNYQIQFLCTNDNGLLDANVISTWKHINGNVSTINYRKSGIVDNYTAE